MREQENKVEFVAPPEGTIELLKTVAKQNGAILRMNERMVEIAANPPLFRIPPIICEHESEHGSLFPRFKCGDNAQ